MQLIYDISILPLLNIPLVLVLLALFATQLYLKTGIKTELYLAISFSLIFILPITLYSTNGDERVLFWSRPYHIAGLSVLLTMLTINWLAEKRGLHERLPLMILTGFIAFITVLPSIIGGFLFGLTVSVYALWLLYQYRKGYEAEFVRIGFLGVIALCVFLGQIIQSKSFIFLYSLLLLSLLLYEALRYFERVVILMKNAGINSITDPLTGLFNKGYLIKKTAQIVRRDGSVGIIFSDIDNFKHLNDSRGHDYGDMILVKVGTIFKDVLKFKGYACRYGGEEMVGIVTSQDVIKLAEVFRERVEKEVGVTISVGVANTNEIEINDNLDDLNLLTITKADKRMYVAKNTGKNRVVYTD